MTRWIICAALVFSALSVTAQEVAMLPPLPKAERADWRAVGLLSKGGKESGGGCTATLIAPDKVLTAAHCVANRGGYYGPPEDIAFWAGRNGKKVAARRYGVRIAVHPIYGTAKGIEKASYDVAILWLNRPITSEVAHPLPLSPGFDETAPLTVLGYQQRDRNILNGRNDCAVVTSRSYVYQLNCHVISGNSGGPVLQRAAGGWHLVGVVSAKTGVAGPGRAIVARIGRWILHQMNTPKGN